MEPATLTLADVYDGLTAPFAPEVIELKPGALTKDKTKALALAYADPRAYEDRLDTVVGPDNWEVEYRPLPGGTGLICRLTILGKVREDVGEAPAEDANTMTSAAAQAFKRTCAKFGLGRYLYHLPQTWAPYDEAKRQIIDAPRVVAQLYRMARLAA